MLPVSIIFLLEIKTSDGVIFCFVVHFIAIKYSKQTAIIQKPVQSDYYFSYLGAEL